MKKCFWFDDSAEYVIIWSRVIRQRFNIRKFHWIWHGTIPIHEATIRYLTILLNLRWYESDLISRFWFMIRYLTVLLNLLWYDTILIHEAAIRCSEISPHLLIDDSVLDDIYWIWCDTILIHKATIPRPRTILPFLLWYDTVFGNSTETEPPHDTILTIRYLTILLNQLWYDTSPIHKQRLKIGQFH